MKSSKQAGPVAKFFITVIMTIAGFVVLFKFGLPQYQKAKESPNWPTVNGIITASSVESRIEKSNKKSKIMYSANINFTYKVNGRDFTAHDSYLGSSSTSSSNQSDARNIVNKYPKGKTVQVFYDPKEPFIGILEPGVKTQHYLFLAIGAVLIVFGGLGLLVTFFKVFVITVAAGSALSNRKTKSSKRNQSEQEGELINLDDDMDEINKASEMSISSSDEPWKHKWIIVAGKKEWGPYRYEKILEFLDQGKVKPNHKCYSPSGGEKVQIGKLSNIKKAS